MKTTIDIPDHIRKIGFKIAKREGTTLKGLICRLLLEYADKRGYEVD